MRTRRQGAGILKLQRAMIGMAPAMALAMDRAAPGIIPVPSWTGSTASITHDPGTPGGVSFTDTNFAIPSGTAVLAAPFNPHVDNFLDSGHTVNTNASAGISHFETSSRAGISLAAGTGVSQTDPNHVQSPSSLNITLLNEWTISSGTFGPPLSGSFSLPYGAKIGPGGSASISIVLNWDVIHPGNNEVPLKNYMASATYLGGVSGTTILTSFTAPTTAFNPSFFSAGDVYVLQGEIDFTADNTNGPTISEIPTAADFGLASNSIYLQPASMGSVIASNLTWTGTQSSTWDTAATPNFKVTSAGTLSFFNSGDNVTFDDGASNAPNVAINSIVSPGSVTVNNSVVNYTFSGLGAIAGGGSLIKGGTASLTLSTPNSFIGGTTLTAGTLNINDPSGIGTGTFNIAGGTIDNTTPAAVTLVNNNAMIWSGDFTFGGSTSLNLGTGPVTLVGTNRTTTSNGSSTLTVGGSISGSGGFTKAGAGTVTFAGPITYSGLTKVVAGTLNLAPSGAGIISETLSDGISIGSTSTVTLIPAATHGNRILVTLGSLSFTGTSGRLDLANNDMRLQSGALATVIEEISQGYGSGNFNGTGGITSSSAAADTTHLTALGVIVNNTNGVSIYGSSGTLGLFDGSDPAPTDVLVKFTYVGDANLDGKIDGSDYSRVDAGFLAKASTWYNGDFNYDGTVNGSDYTLIDNAFNTQGASLAGSITDPNAVITSRTESSGSIPEPATACLLTLASTALLNRRRSTEKNGDGGRFS